MEWKQKMKAGERKGESLKKKIWRAPKMVCKCFKNEHIVMVDECLIIQLSTDVSVLVLPWIILTVNLSELLCSGEMRQDCL